jgi:threonine/homoserine/homoserine lactone efflux protein
LLKPFLEGLLAGYGIAIPVGGIALLILDTGLRHGFRRGFFAGAGASTADLLGALAVAVAGGIIGDLLAPIAGILRIASGLGLVAMGIWGFVRSRRAARPAEIEEPPRGGDLRTYVQFIGLTIINPLTVAYFAAFVLGRSADALSRWDARAAFVAGFALASFSWQTLLAAFGAATHRLLPARVQTIVSAIGNLLVAALGVRMLASGLLRSLP